MLEPAPPPASAPLQVLHYYLGSSVDDDKNDDNNDDNDDDDDDNDDDDGDDQGCHQCQKGNLSDATGSIRLCIMHASCEYLPLELLSAGSKKISFTQVLNALGDSYSGISDVATVLSETKNTCKN